MSGRKVRRAPARYPFAPLEEAVRMRLAGDDLTGQPVGGPRIARALGVNGRQVYRWRDSGVTERQALELAERAGINYIGLWPELLDLAIERERERRRAQLRAAYHRYRQRHAARVLANKRAAQARYRRRHPDRIRATNRAQHERARRGATS